MAGADALTGGGGTDLLQGFAGNDTLGTQDGGIADTADCGADTDLANADVQDALVACESENNPAPGQPGGPPAPPPPVDRRAPALTISGDKKQKSKKKLIVKVSCDESCDIDVSGTIKVPIVKKGKAKKKKTYDLKKASADLGSNSTKKIKVAYSKKVSKKLKKALKAKKKSTAKLKAVATDAAGNSSPTAKFKVKVKK
jgi:Ca2+-binding RTX toxin-like protein